jgi:hypothetical protein
MGNFFNSGPNILKLIVRVRIYHNVAWYNEIYIESTFLLFCFHGLTITLFVLTPFRFLHFSKYN